LLGHTFSKDGISIDRRKLVEVEQWALPRSGTQVSQFLGLMNYFRDFIPSYSTIAAPLESMRKSTKLTDSA
jgi:transposase